MLNLETATYCAVQKSPVVETGVRNPRTLGAVRDSALQKSFHIELRIRGSLTQEIANTGSVR
ncbi:hypothetical protein GCM10008022_40530 [Paenibacillus hunanensis]|nr:hypothetical protein GCM10008022_40530 [Paenibacillus hunanensis]